MSSLVTSLISVCLLAGSPQLWNDPEYEHKWGYVDRTGKEVIAPKFFRAGKFKQGYARCVGSDKNGIPDWKTTIIVDVLGRETPTEEPFTHHALDRTTISIGKKTIVSETDFTVLSQRKGLQLARNPYRFFIVDRNKKRIEIPTDKVTPRGINPKTGNWWFLKGKEALEFTGHTREGELPGLEPAKQSDFIDPYLGIPTRLNQLYSHFGEYSDGLVPAWTKDKHWCYLDKRGRVRITLPDDCCAAHPFSEGLAAVAIGGKPWSNRGGHSQISSFNGAKFGFIDKSGKFVIPPVFPCPDYDWTSRFKNGLALATAEKNATAAFGYINRNGKFVVPAKYSKIEEFSNGLAAFDSREPGFDPIQWKYRRDAHGSLWQFLRQYDIFSMKRTDIIKLLGLPDSVRNHPAADRYLVSQDCLATMFFDVRYTPDDMVYGYAYKEGGMTNPREAMPPPTDWIITQQRPEVDEDLSSFFNRASKVTFKTQ